MKHLKWGLIAAGRIAGRFANGLSTIPDQATALAVGSRDLDKARKFADEHKIARAYGSYEELLADARQRIADRPERYYPAGDPQIFGDTEGGGTQVLYLAGVDFEKLGLPELGDEGVAAQARNIQHGVYRGFIAPVALYGILGAVLWRNRRAAKKEASDE